MTNDQANVFCVIPAFNERENIEKVIGSLKNFGYEIVVVDDCSSDNTHELALKSGASSLRHVINRGQGAALQTGTDYALANGAELIVHFDADGQFMAGEIKDVIAPILTGEADIVFGSRFLGKKSKMPWLKKNVIMPFARIVNKVFLKVNLTDPQSGFRALSVKAAKEIRIEQNRMAHCSEILAKAFASDLKIKEVPITVIYNDFGQRFGGGLKILKELFIGTLLKK